ncbi:MAG: YncE family protein [Ignavibacteria bacterium]
MKKLFLSFILLINIFLIYGCNRDEIINPPVDVFTANGAYILTEGSGAVGSAKLSFYNFNNDVYSENISSTTLGLFPDGLIFNNHELFLCEQGNFGSAGKVYKLDTNGFVRNFSSVGTNPYSLTLNTGKLYLTNGPANNVSVLLKDSLETVTTINVGVYPQEIISIGNKVFVCNTGVFSGPGDSTVTVIDAASDVVIATIRVRKSPSSLAVTNDGKLLVGCPGSVANGIIYKFDPSNYNKLDSFVINNSPALGFDKDIAVDRNSNAIYFITFLNNIAKYDMVTRAHSVFISNVNTSDDFYYGYNFDSKNRIHYVTNAKNFLVNGSINIYNDNASLIRSFNTGIAPRRIVIKN